jgi:hypothetical protein
MRQWKVERNIRELNWKSSVFVDDNGEVKEFKLPYPCDKCAEDARYGTVDRELFCLFHWLDRTKT